MNKPASELIALADAIHAWQQNPATTYTPTNILQDHGDTVVELARLAANQSGVPPDITEFLMCGDPTRGVPPRVIQKAIKAALATPPAQPAPASGESSTSSDGTLPLYETAGGFPVAAAPYQAEETGVIQSTRQGAGVERGMDQCVTGGESAAPPSTHGKPDGAVQDLSYEAQTLIDNAIISDRAFHLNEYRKREDQLQLEAQQARKALEEFIDAALSSKIAAAEISPGDVYREVIDEALIVRHLGVAKGNAKAELNQILDWDVAAALDPAVSGRKA